MFILQFWHEDALYTELLRLQRLALCLQVMREGTDVTLLAFGKLVGYNLKVAEELEKEGISCEV